jgi:hypothetical protein
MLVEWWYGLLGGVLIGLSATVLWRLMVALPALAAL